MRLDIAAVAAVALVLAPTLAPAQARKPRTEPEEVCAASAPPPAAFAGWSQPTDLAAARHPADLPKARIVPGKAVNALLAPVEGIEYRVPPQKADGPQVYGGLYLLRVVEAGIYRVQSGASPPWMDLFQAKTVIKSTSYGHGPACTGLGKYVDFTLQPGDYLVQFSESLKPQTEIMVVKLAQ
jgi:hypothetical protein